MNLELNDRVYLITGGTDGLGLTLAQRLVDEGARVAVCGRDAERLERAQEQLDEELRTSWEGKWDSGQSPTLTQT